MWQGGAVGGGSEQERGEIWTHWGTQGCTVLLGTGGYPLRPIRRDRS